MMTLTPFDKEPCICGKGHDPGQLQSQVPLTRFAKAPVPLPLQAQAATLEDEHDDGVSTLQSAQ